MESIFRSKFDRTQPARAVDERRHMRCRSAWLAAACLLTPAGVADDALVQFFSTAFLPQSVTVPRGGEVVFEWRSGEHLVMSGRPDGDPDTPDEPGRLFSAPLDAMHPVFRFELDAALASGVSFFDAMNPGQLGFIQVESGARTVRVGVVDNAFLPQVVSIFAGDSVRWEHEPNEDFHTVTSGLSSNPADDPGALFDEESSDAKPVFVYQFDAPGEQPYFCRPHEVMGMTGLVRVQENFVRGDASGDGEIDIGDPIATLIRLFAGQTVAGCADAMDTNDDGVVDLADAIFALEFLFLRGADVPAPYPFPGADRTEDGLLCAP